MIPSFAVPPKGFGPGSMTQDSEEDLQYLAMPSGVSVYTPHLPELDDINAARPAIAFLEALRDTMAHWRAGQSVIVRPEGSIPPTAALWTTRWARARCPSCWKTPPGG